MGQQSRRSQATPNPKRILQRHARLLSLGAVASGARFRHLCFVALDGTSGYLAGLVGVRGLRLALNTSVAVLVLSLPFAATAASRASTTGPLVAATARRDRRFARNRTHAASIARAAIVDGRAAGAGPHRKSRSRGDTPRRWRTTRRLRRSDRVREWHDRRALMQLAKAVIRRRRGPLHGEGRRPVETIASTSRSTPVIPLQQLHFDQTCAAGQKIFVRGAELPALSSPNVPSRVCRAHPDRTAPGTAPRMAGGASSRSTLWGHTGVASPPVRSGLGAGDDGVVTATGSRSAVYACRAASGVHVCLPHEKVY